MAYTSGKQTVSDNTPYEKIGNNEPVSIADEVPFEIPDSWEWVRCASLGEIVRGSGIKRTETVTDGLPCVRYGELYTTYNISFVKTKSFITAELDEKCKHFGYGDILMTLTGENKPDIAKAVAYLGNVPVAAGGDLAYWTYHGMNPLYLVYQQLLVSLWFQLLLVEYRQIQDHIGQTIRDAPGW